MSGLIVAVILFGLAGCVSEDETEKGRVVVTWDMVARAIDRQLGEISDGSAATCNGQGLALGWGAHCKDQLQGTVTRADVIQYVEIANDTVLFGGVMPFYFQGFQPQTTSPCIEDLNPANGTPDYLDACNPGGLSCAIVSGHVQLVYNNCIWQEPGPDQWLLDGQRDIYLDLTDSGEEMLILKSKARPLSGNNGFMGTNQSTGASYTFTGDAVRYVWLNPFLDAPAQGTTGLGIDGMELLKATVTVDMNVGALPATYNLTSALDYEDGRVFFRMPGPGVWLSNPGGAPLRFYARGLNWDNVGTGCLVDVINLNNVTRTFDIASQGTYGANGCIADAVGVSY
jgi:hypothetical protein